ncbi:beta-lactamase family protein [Actinotalea ferrariae]|uniref:serine hydrolase domain-containing protein n=1 Tax=Actinotalea ferrariae TaxID=1386098 RepID=UPI001C8C7124|nr:serine hydrolase domain-containing protein [Actinotalea ferrariae]MBX9243296.1 beta-lactamase family protein [Actinotalea ferrariae]
MSTEKSTDQHPRQHPGQEHAPGGLRATSRRRKARGAAAFLGIAALVGGGQVWNGTEQAAALDGAVTSWISPSSGGVAGAPADRGRGNRELQDGLERLVEEDGFPGVLANVVDERGRSRDYTAGVGNIDTGRRVPADGQVRIGSNTKTFTATVVLQLVDEGLVDLDAPIETYLPGLVRGEGIDAHRITVRNLLQHTSGLPNYTAHISLDFFATRDQFVHPHDNLALALAHPADFQPGEQWAYSNTNYTLLGLLIERVTARPLAEQITERIVEPLDLEGTYVPLPGEREIRERHPRGYHPLPDGTMGDITVMDPSWGGAAGDMVSTTRDLNTFFSALPGGELLSPELWAEMTTTVPLPEGYPGDGYGLGLMTTELSCGEVVYGHGGDIPGYSTRGGATADGEAVAIAVTSLTPDLEINQHVEDLVDVALCD